MLFILPGILLIGIIAFAIWGFFFRAVLNQERAVRAARRRSADFERWLSTPGEPLYCVACREGFAGPLPPAGCPRCEVRAFVIPVRASDDPTVAAQATLLPQPSRETAAVAATEGAAVQGAETPQPEILQQGKIKR